MTGPKGAWSACRLKGFPELAGTTWEGERKQDDRRDVENGGGWLIGPAPRMDCRCLGLRVPRLEPGQAVGVEGGGEPLPGLLEVPGLLRMPGEGLLPLLALPFLQVHVEKGAD